MSFNALPTIGDLNTEWTAHETITPPNKLNAFALCQFPTESRRKLGARHPGRGVATCPSICHGGDSRLAEYLYLSPRLR